MASNNETIADIVAQIRAAAHIQNADSPSEVMYFADRIESAHNRELAAKDDERLTVVANYENVIAAKDAEIAKLYTLATHTDNSEVIAVLRARLKVAEDALTELQARCVASVYDGTTDPYEALKIAEDALAAIRGEGGAK